MPVQILMIMMGFAIQSVNNVFLGAHWNLINASAIACGIAYLLAFMFYLAEYYDQLWEPYYLLPSDKIFFRFYSIAVGLVVIAFMSNWPQYWGLYILVLFFILYAKKNATQRAYKEAVIAKYGSLAECDCPKVTAKVALAEAFTHNFLIWGFLFLLPFAIIMAGASALHANGNDLYLWKNINVPHWTFQWVYAVTALFISTLTIHFWRKKITIGIIDMRRNVEAGNAEYFRSM